MLVLSLLVACCLDVLNCRFAFTQTFRLAQFSNLCTVTVRVYERDSNAVGKKSGCEGRYAPKRESRKGKATSKPLASNNRRLIRTSSVCHRLCVCVCECALAPFKSATVR